MPGCQRASGRAADAGLSEGQGQGGQRHAAAGKQCGQYGAIRAIRAMPGCRRARGRAAGGMRPASCGGQRNDMNKQ